MAARTGTTARAKATIPQLSWNQVRPAPVVLISGPEQVLAERSSATLRDLLRSEDPALEVSDLEARSLLVAASCSRSRAPRSSASRV